MIGPSERELLRHFLAAIAYRTQKALRGAPVGFADFRATTGVRTPHELLRHMSDVLGYARTMFTGGSWRARKLPTLAAEIERFHEGRPRPPGRRRGGTLRRNSSSRGRSPTS